MKQNWLRVRGYREGGRVVQEETDLANLADRLNRFDRVISIDFIDLAAFEDGKEAILSVDAELRMNLERTLSGTSWKVSLSHLTLSGQRFGLRVFLNGGDGF